MLKCGFPIVGAAAVVLVLASAGNSRAQMGGFWGGWGTVSPWSGTGNWGAWHGGMGMNYVPGMYTGGYNSNFYGPNGYNYGAFGYRGMGASLYPGYPFGYIPSGGVITPLTHVDFYPPVATPRIPVAAPTTGQLPADQPATVEVVVPADAVVTFDGHRTSQTGTHRLFTTPSLVKGRSYYYTVEATFEEKGKKVTQKRRVEVFASGRTLTRFFASK